MADENPDLTAGVALADIPLDGLLAGRVGDAQVMLARWTDDAGRDRVSALDAACTHRGAQLPTGLRVGDSVVCPFHHACFDLRNGEAVSAPAIAPLNVWQVSVDQDRVTVSGAAEPAPGEPSRVDNDRGVTRVVVVGGGAGGFAAIERLRRVGYTGELALVSAEPHLPLDRPELSKNYLSGGKQVTDLPLVPAAWYVEHAVETHLAVTATALDLAERVVTCSDGTELTYDALVLATGAEPVRPDLPGFDRADAFR
ncbi:MAG TPA: FAD-dependent oxidoreductase, partial [Friedmanniella sp.]